MGKNVMIPLSLLQRVIELMDSWDVSNCNCDTLDEYCSVMWELKVKMQKLELRNTYAKIIFAPDTDAKDEARTEYIRQRNSLGDVDVRGWTPF